MNKAAILLLVFLSACASPMAQATAVDVSGPIVSTTMPVISSGTVVPNQVVTEPAPTAIPALPSGASPTDLKYILLEKYPNLFFCDPDLYPVARADQMELARQRFPELQSNTEEFNSILAHNGLAGLTSFTDEQMLVIYQQHKKLAAISFELSDGGYQFSLTISDGSGQGTAISGWVDGNGAVTIQRQDGVQADCPICLARHTQIDTPNGLMAVENLQAGDLVWTVDLAGRRIRAVILRVTSVPVPLTHQVVHLVLEDGRELWVSPGHPATDQRPIGELRAGDVLDGARVVLAERVLYHDAYTYDLLPSGPTGFYWANGILIGSTLQQP